jgi:circadian clock protein KaiC
MKKYNEETADHNFLKVPTGIAGLDEITQGGLPQGRTTLLLGSTGTGKTFLAMETLARGANQYGEPGVFISLEETQNELFTDFASLGFKLEELISNGKLVIDFISIDEKDTVEAGEYQLDGLLIRVTNLIDSIDAKRVVIDGLPALFSGFGNTLAVRSSLNKLLRWLKDREITTIITAESGTELAQRGLGRTLSDCIISLNLEYHERIATRYMIVAKYRGSYHAIDQFPFMISNDGISVMPVTSTEMDYEVSSEYISSGISKLDAMLGGGYYKGSSIMVSGNAGTGKSSVAASLAASECSEGKRCIYFSQEESPSQVLRNMKVVGINFSPFIENSLLVLEAMRPAQFGLEMQLITIENLVRKHEPTAVIIDPVSNLLSIGQYHQVKSMLTRLIDFLKSNGTTALFTVLSDGDNISESGIGVSSLMDTWIKLQNLEITGERTRLLNIVKSRGMAHSNRIREFLITGTGIELEDVYLGPDGILTGTAREMQEIREEIEIENRRRDIDHKKRQLAQRKKTIESQIASLQIQLQNEEDDLERIIEEDERESWIREKQRHEISNTLLEDKTELSEG